MDWENDIGFGAAYKKLNELEGGLVLHRVDGDRGGLTFGGISQRAWPEWEGWAIIETHGPDDPRLPPLVKKFYAKEYWMAMKLEQVMSAKVATEIFCFGVVAGQRTAGRLVQIICGIEVDGVIGRQTIAAINHFFRENPSDFIMRFKLGQIKRYADIVMRDKSQQKFLLGWINRALA